MLLTLYSRAFFFFSLIPFVELPSLPREEQVVGQLISPVYYCGVASCTYHAVSAEAVTSHLLSSHRQGFQQLNQVVTSLLNGWKP